MNKSQEQWIKELGEEITKLLIRKDKDYGSSFADQYKDYGMLSSMIRMDDKFKRLKTLYKGDEAQVSESIDDTLMDLCGYALMTLIERRKEKIH